MNNYITPIKLDIDVEHLVSISDDEKMIDTSIITPDKRHRLVNADEYLSKIFKKYDCLSPLYNIIRLKPLQYIPIHVDNKRNCAINIPLKNCENSVTIFYKPKSDMIISPDADDRLHYITSSLDESFRFVLDRPILFNTSIPHTAINLGTEDRIIFSWSIHKEYTYEDALNIFNGDVVNALKL